MKWHKCLVFVIILFFIPSIFAETIEAVGPGVEGDGEGECSIYYPDYFPSSVTTVLHCEDSPGEGGYDREDEVVEILDGCQVTCVDAHDPNKEYTITATGTVNMDTSGADDKIGNIDVLVTYSDNEGNLFTMYETHIVGSYHGDESIGRGIVAYFAPSPILVYYNGYQYHELLWDSVATTDPNYVSIDFYESAYNIQPASVWPLFYASDLLFTLTEHTIKATYKHKLDFTTCKDTYLEFYYCGSSGYNLCPYTDETAFLGCYMHEEEGNHAIVTVDSHGHLDV
jgi:hypothetical protein